MGVGTDSGEYFDDEHHYQSAQWDPALYNENERSQVTITPVKEYNYDTALTKDQQSTYDSKYGPNDNQDYDMQGFHAANPDFNRQGDEHYPDTYKKPNHMTFSNESQYNGINGNEGGQWGKLNDGSYTFTPGATNLKNHTPEELQDYFSKYEPGNRLIMPSRAPEKPADAFKSMDLPNAPFGVTAPSELPSGTLQGQVGAKKINDTLGSVIKAGTLAHDVMNGLDPTSQQGIERVGELSQLMVFGPAGLGDKLAVDGTLGSFAGVKSKTLDKTKLYAAQEAEMNGVHPDQVWQDHGMFKGADGRWRYEIPDAGAKLLDKHFDKTVTTYADKEDNLTYSLKDSGKNFFGQNKGDIRLSDVLDHPELYKAYPHLQNIKIGSLPEGSKSFGQFDLTNNELRLGRNLAPEFIKSVLLHETQHAIQKHEGFALGGNPQKFLPQSFHELEAEYNKIPDKTGPGAEKARQVMNKAYKQALEQYNRLMGEVEARAVQKRMDFSPLERKYNTPRSSEDRPRFVQSNAGEGAAHSEVVPMRSAANDNLPKLDTTPLDNALKDHFYENVTEPHEEFIKKYDELHELGQMITKKGNWTELNIARYNKLGREMDPDWKDLNIDPFK